MGTRIATGDHDAPITSRLRRRRRSLRHPGGDRVALCRWEVGLRHISSHAEYAAMTMSNANKRRPCGESQPCVHRNDDVIRATVMPTPTKYKDTGNQEGLTSE